MSDGDEWWLYAARTWVSLAPLGIEGPSGCDECGVLATAAGNTTFFYQLDDGMTAERHLWVLTITPRD